jgi:hypothetical protein
VNRRLVKLMAAAAVGIGAIGGGVTWMLTGGAAEAAVVAGFLSPIAVGTIIALGALAVSQVRDILDRRRANALAPVLAPGVGGGANLAIEPEAPEQAAHVALPHVPLQQHVEAQTQHPVPQRRLYRSVSVPIMSAGVPLAPRTGATRERGYSL